MPDSEPTPEELLRMYSPHCRKCNELATRRGLPASHNTTYLARLGDFSKIMTLPSMWTFDQVVKQFLRWEEQIQGAFGEDHGNAVVAVIHPWEGPFYCDYCGDSWFTYEELLQADEVRKLRPQKVQKTRFDRILEDG